MGAAQTKEGMERSTFARVLDPNGLVLEPTAGWESGELQEAQRTLADQLPRAPQHAHSLSLEITDFPIDQLTPQEETQEQEEETQRDQSSASLVDEAMARVAPPALAKWLADKPEEFSQGENLYRHRRAQSSSDASGIIAAVHRRAASLTPTQMNDPESRV